MPLSFPLPFRQVHLDFHTGPGIPDVGADFDAKAFARALKARAVAGGGGAAEPSRVVPAADGFDECHAVQQQNR